MYYVSTRGRGIYTIPPSVALKCNLKTGSLANRSSILPTYLKMHFRSILSLSALVGSTISAPTSPGSLPDGYPSPSPQQLAEIEKKAGGSLPGGSLPTELAPAAVTTLQLIELNEAFEVAYFTSLLHNITTNAPGYTAPFPYFDRSYIIDAITAVQNQEQLHALGVNAILKSANAEQIAPCEYKFPVSDFLSAITLANTFTDVVLGVLPQAQTVFAGDAGDESPLVNLFGSVIAQEAEQNGFYRSVQHKLPSAAPFLTTEGPAFAFTFLQSVIVPGSCPGVDIVSKSVPTFKPLTVESKPTDVNETVSYSVPGTVAADQNEIVYLSGQNLPLAVPITDVKWDGGKSTFKAELPFQAGFAKGLTIAALVKGSGVKFASINEVADKTIYGPGIIEID